MDPVKGDMRQVLGNEEVNVIRANLVDIYVLKVVWEDLLESLICQISFHLF